MHTNREQHASPISLGDLRIGEQATIVDYHREQRKYLHRLLALGLTRGTVLRVIRKAPLGDPVDISIRGYNLTLRREEASVLILESAP